MRLASNVRLARVSDGSGRSTVFISEQSTGTELTGCVLEGAVECEPGLLLFVTDDVPDEETLSIHLLDHAGKLIDSARIGGPYTTGTFRNLVLQPPSAVRFRFVDEADWCVEVLDRPRVSMPWLPDAKGVWRDAKLTRHMTVRRV
jgi:hypothetical protein